MIKMQQHNNHDDQTSSCDVDIKMDASMIDINNDNKAMKSFSQLINYKRQGCCVVDCGLTSSCARSAASFSEGCWLCSLSSVFSVESTASSPPTSTQDAWIEDSKP